MQRIYESVLQEHLQNNRQMAFLTGPRQVGKTTLGKRCALEGSPTHYLNWDSVDDREVMIAGTQAILEKYSGDVLTTEAKPTLVFDELHKYKDWKQLLKGYFDTLEDRYHIIVTGSAKLNTFRKSGDSLMGRYFLYHIHPLSVAEILGRNVATQDICAPQKINDEQWENLLNFGGFPEAYLKGSKQFYQRWSRLRHEQFFFEDLRELSKIYDISRIELLAQLLRHQVSHTTKYSELSKKVRVTEPTVRNWINLLEQLYYCFTIKPWSKNLARSLVKEPKVYLWDWSLVENHGARIENLVACHLQKAVHFWTDIGLGTYELYYLRDKDKREVDFLVIKDGKPWLMVEVKSSDQKLSDNLHHFNQQLSAPHVLQVCEKLNFVNRDCFSLDRPMVVSLKTFLSQLI